MSGRLPADALVIGMDTNTTIIEAQFIRRERRRKRSITLTADSQAAVQPIIDELVEAGWSVDSCWDGIVFEDRAKTQIELSGPTGSELFADWTTAELRRHANTAKKILAGHGIHNVPTKVLTLADLL